MRARSTGVAVTVASVALLVAGRALAQPAEAEAPAPAPDARPPLAPLPEPQPHARAGGPQLVVSTQVTLAVDAVAPAMDALVALTARLGGRPPARTVDHAEVRVPAERLPELLAELRQLGAELARYSEVRDVSGELADLESSIRSLEATRARLVALQARGRSVDDALRVEQGLAGLDSSLDGLRLQRSTLEREVALASVAVTLTSNEPPPAEPLPQLVLPFAWLETTNLSSLQNPVAPPEQERRERAVVESMIDGGLYGELLTLDGLPGQRDPAYAGVGALRLRGLAPARPVSPAVGLDLGLGGGTGFTYDLGFMLGIGGSFTRWLSFGVVSGAAGRSWTGARIPAAWEIPAELFVVSDLKDWGRFTLQVRPQWIPPRIEARQDGSALGFADELIIRGTLALAPLAGADELEEGSLRLGVAYHELRDTALWTFVLGWGAGETETRYLD